MTPDPYTLWPGSSAALAAGCTCSILDNWNGDVVSAIDHGGWRQRSDCPVHGGLVGGRPAPTPQDSPAVICEYHGHEWGDAGGGLLVCLRCGKEKSLAIQQLEGVFDRGPLRSNPEAVHSLVVHLVGDGRVSCGAYIRNAEGTFDWHPACSSR